MAFAQDLARPALGLRVVHDGPGSGERNMAEDARLLEAVAAGQCEPTLRFYEWSEPCYTIGYFQDDAYLERSGRPVIRRPTGGGAVLHGDDQTFSLALPLPFAPLSGDVRSSYLKISQALLDRFKPVLPGIDFADCKTMPSGRAGTRDACFERPVCYDLVWKGRKVAGSSQRRRAKALLYQCSLFMPLERALIRRLVAEAFLNAWGMERRGQAEA